ncbi:MAG: HAD-IA family hydrolase [Bacteroidota bacterium]
MNSSNIPYRLRCIVFDMDGTLTQTHQLIFDSFNHIAEKYINKRLTPEEIVALFGPPEEEAVQNMIGAQHIKSAMDEYYHFYQERHNDLAWLYPGIKEVLDFVKQKGIIVALFTGKGRRTTEITLHEFGIEQYFDLVVTGDDVDHFKPSGDGIRKIMQNYSLQADEVLMVGDAVADVKAARECGVRIASVVWDSYSLNMVVQSEADFLFHDVQEFHSWLEETLQQSTLNNQQ